MPDLESQSGPPVQVLYFNGFPVTVGNADFSLRMRLDNLDVLELKCSYSTGKTLAEKLAWAVRYFEKVTDHNLMSTEEVLKHLQRASKEKPE